MAFGGSFAIPGLGMAVSAAPGPGSAAREKGGPPEQGAETDTTNWRAPVSAFANRRIVRQGGALETSSGSTSSSTSVWADGGQKGYSAVSVRKRKATEDPEASRHPPVKRPLQAQGCFAERKSRLVNKALLLPPEIWHHIFTFLPPRALGNLLATGRVFNLYLDPAPCIKASFPPRLPYSIVSPLEANAIWRASRRCYWPRMPAPLKGSSELDMWRLACSSTCQFCGTRRGTWHSGSSGSSGSIQTGSSVAPILAVFPFRVRACRQCLEQRVSKDVDVLLSPTMPSVLMPALPFVLVTSQMDLVPSFLLMQNQASSMQHMVKVFWTAQVDSIKAEFESVKAMGQAAAEEWIKGLENRGREARADHTRWEKWAAAGGLTQMRTALFPGHQTRQGPAAEALSATVSVAAEPSKIDRTGVDLTETLTISERLGPAGSGKHEPKRTREEVEELKTRRSAEIERLEREKADEAKAAQKKFEEKRTAFLAKEAVDREWDDTQGSVRAALAGLADEAIRDTWSEGRKVNKDSCLRFAAQVLSCVRKRFYAYVAKEEAAARSAGHPLPDEPIAGPWTRKLTLENMKWVFDLKVKPRTERYRKELFACNGCEANARLYGLEGIIQHYAAKHTNALSLGSVVVHWRAEWPAELPFYAEPPGQMKRLQKQSQNTKPQTRTRTQIQIQTEAQAQLQAHPPPPSPSSAPGSAAHGTSGASTFSLPPDAASRERPQRAPPFIFLSNGSSLHAGSGRGLGAGPAADNNSRAGITADFAGVVGGTGNGYEYGHGPEHANGDMTRHSRASPVPTRGAHMVSAVGPYQQQLDEVVRNWKEIWNSLASFKHLPGNIKVAVALFHVAKRHKVRFSEIMPQAMFMDGLSKRKDMKPARKVKGLMCRTCLSWRGQALHANERREVFTLQQLINHFANNHADAAGDGLDWTTQLVLVHDDLNLASIGHGIGSNNANYKLIIEAVSALALENGSACPQQTSDSSDPRPVFHKGQGVTRGNGEYSNPAVLAHRHSRLAESLPGRDNFVDAGKAARGLEDGIGSVWARQITGMSAGTIVASHYPPQTKQVHVQPGVSGSSLVAPGVHHLERLSFEGSSAAARQYGQASSPPRDTCYYNRNLNDAVVHGRGGAGIYPMAEGEQQPRPAYQHHHGSRAEHHHDPSTDAAPRDAHFADGHAGTALRRQDSLVYQQQPQEEPGAPPRPERYYEIIRGRDEHGEYIFRRPIIMAGDRLLSRPYVAPYGDGGSGPYRELSDATPYPGREHEHARPTGHHWTGDHCPAYVQHEVDGPPRNVGGDGDYDPRYPSGPPAAAARRAGYESCHPK